MESSLQKSEFRKIVRKWEKLRILVTNPKNVQGKKRYHLNKSELADYMNIIFNHKPTSSEDRIGFCDLEISL